MKEKEEFIKQLIHDKDHMLLGKFIDKYLLSEEFEDLVDEFSLTKNKINVLFKDGTMYNHNIK